MADDTKPQPEPRGFGEHVRGLAGEYAHEQGWGLNEPERTHEPETPQDTDGGTNYEYGARDFGDTPVNGDLIEGGSASASPAAIGLDRPPLPPAKEQQTAPLKTHGDPLDSVI